MNKILAALLALWVVLIPPLALADGIFVAPTAVGTATPGQIPATQTNSTPCSTCVGFQIISSVSSGGAVNITPSGTIVNVTSTGVLPAGVWKVYGIVTFNGGATTTVTVLNSGISTTSVTLPGSATQSFYGTAAAGATAFVNGPISLTAFPAVVSSTGSTTGFLEAQCTFGINTCSAWGTIVAERM